jgi:hypothetical protein
MDKLKTAFAWWRSRSKAQQWGLVILFLFVLGTITPKTEKASSTNSTSRVASSGGESCQSSSANIVDNLTLYSDASCKVPIGVIKGISADAPARVLIQFSSGSTEYRLRSVVTSTYYVRN